MESLPHCQVCRVKFSVRGPAPLLLPCLHAVCGTCVTSTAGASITCRTCQRDINLTETSLEKDVVRLKQVFHVTAQHCPTDILCTFENDGNQALCWCAECDVLLCEYCQELHNRFKSTRNHSTQNVSDMTRDNFTSEEYCQTHKNIPIDIWDTTCQRLICAKCKLGDHADHDVQDVEIAAETMRGELEARRGEVKQVAESNNSHMETCRQHLQTIDNTSRSLENRIHATFNAVQIGMQQREKEIHVSLQNQSDQARKGFELKNQTYKIGYQASRSTAEYLDVALQCCSNVDILGLKYLREKINSCTANAPSSGDICPSFIFCSDKLDQLRQDMSSYGEVSMTDDDQVQQQQQQKDETTQTDLELTDVDDLQNKAELTPELQSTIKSLEGKVKDLAIELSDLSEDKAKADKSIKQIEQIVAELGIRIHQVEESKCILFPELKLDTERVNVKTKIDQEGHLCRVSDTPPGAGVPSKNSFVNYLGTSSTAPLAQCAIPQYWEVEAHVTVSTRLGEGSLVLEIGVCREEEKDKSHHIGGQAHSYSLSIVQCPTHDRMCGFVWKGGDHVTCHQLDSLANTPGHQCTLSYGFMYDNTSRRVAFIDLSQHKVIYVFRDVDCSRVLWPMFGVYNDQLCDVKLKLVVGKVIVMTDRKYEMICKALS